jgi:lipoprotein-anchoring transpeptidase ErfK/SrfK
MRPEISRRDFLKISAAALAGLSFRDFPPGQESNQYSQSDFSLGRAIHSVRYYRLPSVNSEEFGYYNADTVVNVVEQTYAGPGRGYSSRWLRTKDGWIPGTYVQPVKNELNQPVLNVPSGGMLVEVTVPYTQSYVIRAGKQKHGYRYYYKSTHWVKDAFMGSYDIVWYQVLDDLSGEVYSVEGAHLRPVTPTEITPISPGVPDKLIQVELDKQKLVAYEGSRPVFAARVSTGYFDGSTPRGEFRVERKQPSSHMTPLDGNAYDLPGVPWVCYISWTGVSLHGTYWHHNYGTPQSRGCINLTPEAAQWCYRWTEPTVPPGEDYLETEAGTRVVVI